MKKLKKKGSKLAALLLAFVMLFTIIPTTTLALDDEQEVQGNEQNVTVYLSVTKDADFVTAEDGTTMALEKVTVPYFDLSLYGLENIYYNPDCYKGTTQTGGTKETAEGNVTILHLLIWATEVYQDGVAPEDAGKGWLAKNNWKNFSITKDPGSAYINTFWNMGSNVNYYLNYEYCLGKPGWGATCDQILLHDNDVVSVRHNPFAGDDGTYYHFGENGIVSQEVGKGNELNMFLYYTKEDYTDYTTKHVPAANETIYLNKGDISGNHVENGTELGTTDSEGKIVIQTKDLDVGTYYITSDTDDPAIMILEVTEDKHIHKYTTTVTEPTCFTEGYTTYTCECGDSYKGDYVSAKGHNYVDGVCTRCNKKKTVIPEGEVYTDIETDVPGDIAVKKLDSIDDLSYNHVILPDGATTVYFTFREGTFYQNGDKVNAYLADKDKYPIGYWLLNVVKNEDGLVTVEFNVKDAICQKPGDGPYVIFLDPATGWHKQYLSFNYASLDNCDGTVTFNPDNGDDKITKTVKGGETLDYIPETPTKEGYTFVGWYTNVRDTTTEYKNNQTYEYQNVTYRAKWAHVSMLGAQVKSVVNDKSGIRFGTKIYDSGDTIIEKGTLMIPANLLKEGEKLTLDTPKAAKSVSKVDYETNEEEDYVIYLGTLVNIPRAQFDTQIAATAYVTYRDRTGHEYTVYVPYSGDSTSVNDLLGNDVD